jgi:hypothetical protein
MTEHGERFFGDHRRKCFVQCPDICVIEESRLV